MAEGNPMLALERGEKSKTRRRLVQGRGYFLHYYKDADATSGARAPALRRELTGRRAARSPWNISRLATRRGTRDLSKTGDMFRAHGSSSFIATWR